MSIVTRLARSNADIADLRALHDPRLTSGSPVIHPLVENLYFPNDGIFVILRYGQLRPGFSNGALRRVEYPLIREVIAQVEINFQLASCPTWLRCFALPVEFRWMENQPPHDLTLLYGNLGFSRDKSRWKILETFVFNDIRTRIRRTEGRV